MRAETEQLIRDSLRGVVEINRTDRGLTLSRLPRWSSIQHRHDPLTQKVANQASGARLLLASSATEITLTYRSTRDATMDGWQAPPSSVTVATDGFEESLSNDNGDLRVWDGPVVGEVRAGQDSIASFSLPATDAVRTVSIWLPHNCDIELLDLTANAALAAAEMPATRWVHYGSSISHCVEAESPLGVWPSRVAQDLNLDLFSLGLAGSANIEQFAAKTIRDAKADLISLKLGANVVAGATMTERTFIPAVHAFLDTVRETHPDQPILLMSPIYAAGFELQPGPARNDANGQAHGSQPSDLEWVKELNLRRVRDILEKIALERQDPNLHYVDGLQLFGESDSHLMVDGLHPNADGYLLIAERVRALLLGHRPNL